MATKENKIKEVELLVNDEHMDMTISAISLVTSPAIEELFVFFNKQNEIVTLAKIDEEARCLVSPALIPEKRIVRFDKDTNEEYNVFFTAETIKQCSELYLMSENNNTATEQHEKEVSGVHTVESWIKEGDQDKSNLFGFDLPIGTWFVKMKINNDDLWSKIKSKELRGLSIEGMFTQQLSKLSTQDKPNTVHSKEDILKALVDIINENN
mgnify:FL=1|tara:strand:+ start:1766 stop:2395 length:630 start_codon:yes stop_codon:yes gene_type:complete